MADNLAPREVGERIEQLIGELSASEASVAARAEQLVALLVQMYGQGLKRIVDGIDQGRLREMAKDPVVAGILVLHDLHPDDTLTRVEAALDTVRPYLGSHAGGVEFLGVTPDGVARLRLQGSCDGCPASTVTVKMAIEGAILEAAPEVVSVEVEGVDLERRTGPEPVPVQIGEKPAPRTEPAWVSLEGPVPRPGTLRRHTLGDFDIVVAGTGGHTYAHRGDCPGCGADMVVGTLEGTILACAGCGRRYDLAAAGRSVTDDLLLDPVPLIEANGTARVAVPEVVG